MAIQFINVTAKNYRNNHRKSIIDFQVTRKNAIRFFLTKFLPFPLELYIIPLIRIRQLLHVMKSSSHVHHQEILLTIKLSSFR